MVVGLTTASPTPAATTAAPKSECPANQWTVDRLPEHFDPEYRLRRDVFPQHYDVSIDVNVGDSGKFDFAGHVAILVRLQRLG